MSEEAAFRSLFNLRGKVVTTDKDLQRDIGLLQSRNINMTIGASAENVSAPKQGVDVKIGNKQIAMQFAGIRGHHIRRWVAYTVIFLLRHPRNG